MKAPIILTAALLALSACNLTKLPDDPRCPEGTKLHTSPAGVERCIKPGMAVGEGVIEGGLLFTGGVLAAQNPGAVAAVLHP